ncbi:hypothetical protein L9F63_018333 [Diploptera punctata]|uniref:Sodium/calcium exchanger membrane region domain-containing protein n=1 Tax=Diploptera punctata TaxID=6984 RepID=A0AAD8EFC5_DIPPU|nr:hypothetical protein L9F63_018333 [Diploptera punctata]
MRRTRPRLRRERWQVTCGLVLLYALVQHVASNNSGHVPTRLDDMPSTTSSSSDGSESTMDHTTHTPHRGVPTLRPRRVNCTPPAIEQFPRPLMGAEARKSGGLIIHILAAVYTFLGLAIVCDDYFVSSLDRICEELKLSPDVAGATFMAAGSSAPELATVVIGVFFAKDDIGISGVIGSAVFNIMFVISVCALCAGTVCNLNWWPLIRDCFFYAVSILVMLFTISNEVISWPESLFMLLMYVVYCIVLHYNSRLERWAQTLPVPCRQPSPEEESALVSYRHLEEDRSRRPSYTSPPPSATADKLNFNTEPGDILVVFDGEITWEIDIIWYQRISSSPESSLYKIFTNSSSPGGKCGNSHYEYRHDRSFPADKETGALPQQQGAPGVPPPVPPPPANADYYKSKESKPVEDEVSPLVRPTEGGMWAQVSWGITVPIHALCRATMPDCKKERWRHWYPFTFLISMIWISFYSYIMIFFMLHILCICLCLLIIFMLCTGSTLGIPDTVMGLTFMAAGVSVPDALSSLAVVKEGYGDMAVSNAVGSNVFDILICLGLPWFIQTALIKPGSHVNVYSKGLTYSTLSLLSTVLFLVVATHLNGWKLDKKYGIILMVWYLLFITFASLYELNVFGNLNPPECPSNY